MRFENSVPTNMILCACLLLCLFSALSFAESRADNWHEVPAKSYPDYALDYPDLSQYTGENIQKILDAIPNKKPKVTIERMFNVLSLSDFTAGERAAEWAKRQSHHPVAIVLSEGKTTLSELYRLVGNSHYLEKINGFTYLLRLPLVVEHGATLVLDKSDAKQLYLSNERGAFISNSGNFFAMGVSVIGWLEREGKPAAFEGEKVFRPFFASWGGSKTYLYQAIFANLGYEQSKSYGFTLSRYKHSTARLFKQRFDAPTGWLIESTFEDIYYGFYCYEAEDVVIYKNTYKNNEVYGVDPHDRSERLIIAENDVYGTKKKHGIIISREVNHSWIINNRSHHNRLSGVVLDRSCEHNQVAFNDVYENGANGITFYESNDNTVFKNKIHANDHHGIRVRNSSNIELIENEITANGRMGIVGVSVDLHDTVRNLDQDPYHEKFSLSIAGGVVAANASGSFSFEEPEFLRLQGVKLLHPIKTGNIEFPGFLGPVTQEILKTLASPDKAIVYQKKPVIIEEFSAAD